MSKDKNKKNSSVNSILSTSGGSVNENYPEIQFENYQNPEILGKDKYNDEFSEIEDKLNIDQNKLYYIEKTNNYSNQKEYLTEDELYYKINNTFSGNKNDSDSEMKEDEKNNEPTEKEAYKNENNEIKKKEKEKDKIEQEINKNDDKKDNNINSINIEIKKDADNIGDENKNNDKNLSFININNSTQYPIFSVNTISSNTGNKLVNKRISFRIQNQKSKIVRNFIQEVIPDWIYGDKPKKKDKINRNNIINNFKLNKKLKLSDIYIKDIKSDLIKKDITLINSIIFQNEMNKSDYKFESIKYEFTLKEAFLCFESEDISKRKKILSNVLERLNVNNLIDENLFFEGLDNKVSYINGLELNDEKYCEHYYKAFEEIIKDLT
jgi:hypothetical protein